MLLPRAQRCRQGRAAARPSTPLAIRLAPPGRALRIVAVRLRHVVQRGADLLRQLDILCLERPGELRGSAGTDDRGDDARPVPYPGKRDSDRGDAEPVRRGQQGVDDAGGAFVEVGPYKALVVLGRTPGVGRDAVAVLAGQHSAPERRPGDQPQAVVGGGRYDLALDAASEQGVL